jgi:hypothetical protein
MTKKTLTAGWLLFALTSFVACAVGDLSAGTNIIAESPATSTTATTATGTGGAMGGLCPPGATQPCYSGPSGTAGVGICKAGTQTCAADGMSWGACAGEVLPQPENCATPVDDDCDGQAPACSGGAVASRSFGDANSQLGRAVASDSHSNILVVADGAGTIDFGGGPVSGGSTGAVFVAKLDPNLGQLWALGFTASNSIVRGLAVDGADAVLVGGSFTNTLDVGGGVLTSASGADVFVTKRSAGGAHVWSRRLGGLGNQSVTAVAAGSKGDVLLVGGSAGALDFGGTSYATAGSEDGYVVKLAAADGGDTWIRPLGGAGSLVRPMGVAVDRNDNVLVAGHFAGAVDFGGGVLTSTGGAAAGFDVFVVKFDAAGKHLWSKRFGDAADHQEAAGVAVDAQGSVFVTGSFLGTIDFGGGALTTAGGSDIFLVKLDAGGSYQWAKRYGDAADQRATSVAVDVGGNVLITGGIAGVVDFGGGMLAGFGGQDVFLTKLDTSGSYVWAKRYGNAQDQQASSIAADPSSNVLLTGSFLGGLDFGVGALSSGGGSDIFLAKFAP